MVLHMEFKWPQTNLEWLPHRTIFLTVHGSQAYGTNRPDSDLDIRGVCIPPARYFHGFVDRFENAEFKGDPDMVVFDIRKFFKLCTDCNPNALEILFTDPRHHIKNTFLGGHLVANRDLFLSRKAQHTFSGYAMAQLKKIRLHRRWLLNPPRVAPTRWDFNLPERTLIPADQLAVVWASVRAKLEEWDVDLGALDDAGRIAIKNRIADVLAEQELGADNQWQAAARVLGINENFIELMDREKRYQAAQTEWTQYQNWLKNRNPARAELEARYGYDTKHGMHLVRLLRMGREILDGHGVQVFREDRAELTSIRDGAWSFDRLIEYAERAEADLKVAAAQTKLPWGPDMASLDTVCSHLIESALDT